MDDIYFCSCPHASQGVHWNRSPLHGSSLLQRQPLLPSSTLADLDYHILTCSSPVSCVHVYRAASSSRPSSSSSSASSLSGRSSSSSRPAPTSPARSETLEASSTAQRCEPSSSRRSRSPKSDSSRRTPSLVCSFALTFQLSLLLTDPFLFVSVFAVAENLQAFILAVTDGARTVDVKWLILVQMAVFLPLSLVRSLTKLSGTALIADAFILVGR